MTNRHEEKNMKYRAVLGFFFALTLVVWGAAPLRNSHTTRQAEISGRRGQLVGTWKLISRVVTLEDGTALQDPGLGKTPSGYLMYDSSGHMAAQLMRPDRPVAIDCGMFAPATRENTQSR